MVKQMKEFIKRFKNYKKLFDNMGREPRRSLRLMSPVER